jgi:hypothetical protein
MSVIIEQKQNRQTVEAHVGQQDVFLQRIPDAVYQQIVDTFSRQYHFRNGLENGGRMRIANYFVGISASLARSFNQFITSIERQATNNRLPVFQTPNGFAPQKENLVSTEQGGGFSMGSFDMAVTDQGLRNIESQAVATYPVSSALLNRSLLQLLPDLDKAFLFADGPHKSWDDFQQIYQNMLGGEQGERVVLTDRRVQEQKTNFEFYATQKELGIPVDIVDMESFFEQDNGLYYRDSLRHGKPVRITRLYNRVILADALFLENYPEGSQAWNFRFDKEYNGLKLVNHPIKQFQISKRLAPYIRHPMNPTCHELADVASAFRQGILAYEDYVWKHKWGAAGHRLFLRPSERVLDELTEVLDEYIAQKKVEYTTFITDDGQEKIVELRFMTARYHEQTITVPMARIGHVERDEAGRTSYKIHFADNNMAGYGFSPVLIF